MMDHTRTVMGSTSGAIAPISRAGGGTAPGVENATYTNNKRNGFTYDAAGNLTNDLAQTLTYDATGQQATASYSGYSLQQTYDGDRLRVKKVENSGALLTTSVARCWA